jgi:hypothetical protein
MDPALITEALERRPSTQWRIGELRRGPRGQLGQVYENTYWTSELTRGEDSQLLDAIDAELTELEKRAAFLQEFYESGGTITYYVSWFASDRSGGDTIGFRTLGRFAKLHVDLSLDVYSARPDSNG